MESLREVRESLARTGHGHVVPTVSGLVARCGGPGLCSQCAGDAMRLAHSICPQCCMVPADLADAIKGYCGSCRRWTGLVPSP